MFNEHHIPYIVCYDSRLPIQESVKESLLMSFDHTDHYSQPVRMIRYKTTNTCMLLVSVIAERCG